ncbi:PilZ domain-containing protein [Vibrio genomosp. F10 str. 9ZC157]|uniref:Pilus assembly protein PilZ n=1 Tax=Vibrio genomosp. F10 str. ZF-129 TaxID=1187848 RepID=A0A1E5BC04_9VIBR|nr:flagellar brake protein [Vibrio genomosp. F10]OEE31301.1 pilus assembly protein PilZ [Vibrio genomosp. F10 str. ZF-129]OEE96532.1 pilus assembly protein PilZ [Vibrio genomosp. F10 str. 9ZC157]OEE97180.1 pilus assembly protein PilZ [Vibrio genomosp. F10 str. 9ZD137]
MKPRSNSITDLYPLLIPGLKLSAVIEFGPNDTLSFATHIIGHKSEHYIVIDMPTKAKEALLMRKIDNTSIIIRGICHTKLGHVIAFKTRILSKISRPVHAIFLRQPKHFISKPTRTHERFSFDIPAVITEETKTYQGHLVDISVSGCALFLAGENELTLSSVIEVQSEVTELLDKNIKYTIANIQKQKEGHKIGIRFSAPIEMNDSIKNKILELAVLSNAL